jgi:hypothetical protein
MKRILIITDSLGLARSIPEMVKFEETWPQKLKKHFIVHQISIGGATVDFLFEQLDYHLNFNPDYVILQSGIVDAAPRALTKFENDFFNHFYITRRLVNLILPKFSGFFRKARKITYTNSEKYEKNVQAFIHIFHNKLFWIGIPLSCESYEKKVPGISKSINKFNELLQNNLGSNYVSLEKMPANYLMSDHHHLNMQGHNYIYDQILERLLLT